MNTHAAYIFMLHVHIRYAMHVPCANCVRYPLYVYLICFIHVLFDFTKHFENALIFQLSISGHHFFSVRFQA
uniref:Secreted protein n=1 Tax=Steinernema glaseri TaxID=37863 RepID=A0A1I8AV41_9BILA